MNTPPPPPPPPSSSTPPPPPNGQPAKSGSKILVIILCIVLGFFVLVGGCVAACVYYAAKKTKEYSAAAEKNPQLAAVTLIATMTPDIQIVSKDERTGTITLRNKKSGEVTTIDTSQYTTENIGKAVEQFSKGLAVPSPTSQNTSSSNSTSSTKAEREEAIENREGDEPAEKPSTAQAAALNNTLKKFPSAVTAYPGSTTVEATLNSFGGIVAGSYGFTTKDSTEKVVSYYEEKLKSAGYTIATKSSDTNQYGQVTQMVAVHADPEASFTISAEARAHDVHATINIGQKN